MAERPVALPPVTREAQYGHGPPSHTAAECARKSREMDDHLAAWEPKLMDMLKMSRDAIARSRQVLDAINGRDAKSRRHRRVRSNAGGTALTEVAND